MVRRSAVMKVAALLGALVVSGCRGCGGGTNMVETRFRVAPETASLEFGRVLEGTMVTKQVTLIAETRASVSVGATTMAPFSTMPLVDVPGGSQVDLDVTFRAGNGESNGELVLTSGRQEVRVALHGVGVRPPFCPAATCRMSSYSLELDRCVETLSPDETACEPTSQCLEQGRCRMGECLGVARRCNDNDACTSDACSMDAGCINTRIVCPQPTTPCRVPTCDARMGCGEAMAPDGMPCGTSNCVSSKLCVSGECQEIPTPDGTECAPAIACYGISRCKDQKCERPDAGAWLPAWTARVEGQPLAEPPALLSFGGGTVFFTVCGLTPLPVDAGQVDAGVADAGVEDAGLDGGDVDAGDLDGGDLDGGDLDGGDVDAGPPTECALVSYTGTGFERFTARSNEVERLSHVGPTGVVLRVDGGIIFRARAMGSLLGGWETGTVSASRIAMLRDGGVLVAMRGDGGTHLVMTSTMSAEPLAFLPADITHVATGLDDSVFALSSTASLTRLGLGADGGFLISTLQLDAGSTPMLATAGESTVAFDQLVQWSASGFLPPRPFEAPPDAGQQPRDVIITPSTVFLFFKGCVSLAMSCLPEDEVGWVRAFSRNTGALLWEDRIFPARSRARLVEATALRIPGGIESALAAVIEGEVDGGVVNGLVVNVDGGRSLECPFPDGTGRLIAGTFAAGQLVTLATRPDGGVTLEGWPLGALPLETSGWVSAEGSSGQRRATP